MEEKLIIRATIILQAYYTNTPTKKYIYIESKDFYYTLIFSDGNRFYE